MRASALLITLILAAPPAAQPVIYVRAGATGVGNGTSWANAYSSLQPALTGAVPPAQIWVAAGTYAPTSGTNRTATFRLRNGVIIYGGFDGTETALEERDWVLNVTTLSGEIASPTSVNDNSCHVVTASGVDSTAIVDGFSITGGYARVCALSLGGGLVAEAGSPVVRNCRFFQNLGVGGGAVYNMGGSAGTFVDCVFEGNEAVSGGGGVGNEGSSPRLVRAVFRDNTAVDGGALLNWDESYTVCLNCTFEENTAPTGNGGAVYNQTSATVFIDARFVGNFSRAGGGGVWNEEVGADMVCVGCHFEGNVSENGAGGAVYSTHGRPTFVNTVFEGNLAVSDNGNGGAIHLGIGSVAQLYNVVLSGNRSGLGGGALHANSGWFEAVNLTAAGNRAGASGQHSGAVLYSPGGSLLHNVVLWDNQGTSIIGGSSTVEVQRGIVEGGCTSLMTCEAVQDADPRFVRPPFTDGPADYGDLRLREGSPGLDAGLGSLLPPDVWDLDADGDTTEALPLDLAGAPRVEGAEVDLGAYEGGVVVSNQPVSPPAEFALLPAYPNPFTQLTTVAYELPAPALVQLTLFDVLGRRVLMLMEQFLVSGRHHVLVDGSALPAGKYVVRVRMSSGGSVRTFTQTLTLLR